MLTMLTCLLWPLFACVFVISLLNSRLVVSCFLILIFLAQFREIISPAGRFSSSSSCKSLTVKDSPRKTCPSSLLLVIDVLTHDLAFPKLFIPAWKLFNLLMEVYRSSMKLTNSWWWLFPDLRNWSFRLRFITIRQQNKRIILASLQIAELQNLAVLSQEWLRVERTAFSGVTVPALTKREYQETGFDAPSDLTFRISFNIHDIFQPFAKCRNQPFWSRAILTFHWSWTWRWRLTGLRRRKIARLRYSVEFVANMLIICCTGLAAVARGFVTQKTALWTWTRGSLAFGTRMVIQRCAKPFAFDWLSIKAASPISKQYFASVKCDNIASDITEIFLFFLCFRSPQFPVT